MARNKKAYSWLGGGENIEPMGDASTATTELIQLIPAQPVADTVGARTQFLIEAIYLHFSIHRLLITELDACGFIVWQAPVTEASNLPAQSLDALSTTDRLYANKRIMMMAPLPVPPIFLSGDLVSATVDERVMTSSHEYQAMRKHDRSNTVLAMAVNSDVDIVLSVFCQWRVLVSWAA